MSTDALVADGRTKYREEVNYAQLEDTLIEMQDAKLTIDAWGKGGKGEG